MIIIVVKIDKGRKSHKYSSLSNRNSSYQSVTGYSIIGWWIKSQKSSHLIAAVYSNVGPNIVMQQFLGVLPKK